MLTLANNILSTSTSSVGLSDFAGRVVAVLVTTKQWYDLRLLLTDQDGPLAVSKAVAEIRTALDTLGVPPDQALECRKIGISSTPIYRWTAQYPVTYTGT